ncbi:unnamed protein product [Blepharisma stoltei]|uniref:Dickkopf N-terminal cysteine-rich domain-containing protein n=1 Tax=Blepharisma stoltei TaxID=1481888 RepID=A0AAU9IMF6_9CILI|nr:unnamed protein product [Blepharisma stoltei]
MGEKFYAVLLFISLSLVLSKDLPNNPNCPIYTCKTSGQSFVNSTCIFYTQTAKNPTYFINACSSVKAPYCTPSVMANSTCEANLPSPPLNAWPGEKCRSSSDCNSLHAPRGCVSGICVGSQVNEVCYTNDDCNPGLRCLNQICTPQIPIGQSQCTSDYDCVNSAGCNVADTPQNSVCTPYFSISSHLPVGDCTADNVSYLCNSGLCMDNNGVYECMNLLSSKEFPNICQVDGDCYSTRDDFFPNGILYGTCYCGYNPTATSYCSIFPGDKPYLQVTAYLKKWIQSSNINSCNTMRRFDIQCMSDWWEKKEFNYYYYYLLSADLWPLIEGSEKCTQEVYLANWYQAKKNT